MEATLTSPSGKIDPCEIRDLPEDSLCQIDFTPTEEGVHTISLKFKGIHFAGKLNTISVRFFVSEYVSASFLIRNRYSAVTSLNLLSIVAKYTSPCCRSSCVSYAKQN